MAHRPQVFRSLQRSLDGDRQFLPAALHESIVDKGVTARIAKRERPPIQPVAFLSRFSAPFSAPSPPKRPSNIPLDWA